MGLGLIACLLLGCLSQATVVNALSISPSLLDVPLVPGETKTVAIQVTNDERVPLQLYPSIQKFVPLGAGGQQRFLPPEDTSGMPSWTFVGVDTSSLQPGETRVVPVQIRVPLDAANGGVYEAIFFSTQPPVSGSDTVGIRSRIGALVLGTVGSEVTPTLTVESWRLLEPSRRASVRGTVQLILKNGGRTHGIPEGAVVVRNLFGTEVARVPLNPSSGRILPASERMFEVSFGPSTLSEVKGLREELSAVGFGGYRVTLEGVEHLQQPSVALTFFVLPWRLILIGVGVIACMAVCFRLYRKKLLRSLQRSS